MIIYSSDQLKNIIREYAEGVPDLKVGDFTYEGMFIQFLHDLRDAGQITVKAWDK